MRWKQAPDPKHHDTRTRNVFLLFPKCLGGQWRWLERASIVEKFIDILGERQGWWEQSWAPDELPPIEAVMHYFQD